MEITLFSCSFFRAKTFSEILLQLGVVGIVGLDIPCPELLSASNTSSTPGGGVVGIQTTCRLP